MAPRPRTPVSLTFGLCIAGGLAAGVALARPASSDDGDTTDRAAATADAAAADDGLRYEYPSVSDDQGADTGAQTDSDADVYGGTSQDASSDEPEDVAPAPPAAITIADFAFGSTITVEPGAEIAVTNVDGAPHSVTADDVDFDSGVLNRDEAATIVAPDQPGTYTFFCIVHPSMQGELVVS